MGRAAGSGSVTLLAAVGTPCFILVEDITGGTGGSGPIQLAYSEITANVAMTTSLADIPGLSATVSVPAGRRIKVSAHIPGLFGISTNTNFTVQINEGATSLQQEAHYMATGFTGGGADPVVVLTPTAGTHTYKVQAAIGTGTASIFAGTDRPCFILVEDITGTPSPAGIMPTSQTLAFTLVTTPGTQTYTNTEVDLTNFNATFSVPDGRRVRISYGVYPQSSVSNDNIVIKTYLDGVSIDENRRTLALANSPERVEHFNIITPSAGTHTIKLTSWRIVGTGTITQNNGTGWPCWLLIEDITGGSPAVNSVNVPVGQIAYSESTTNIVGTTGVDLAGISINIAVPAGRTIKIRAYAQVSPSAISDWYVSVVEGVTEVGRVFTRSFATLGYDFIDGAFVISPSAGSHTYKLNATRFAGTGTLNLDAVPKLYLMAEDITATPATASGAPSSTLGYAEVTANQTGITTETDITGLSTTVTVSAGRRIRITGYTIIASSVATDSIRTSIKEGATLLNFSEIKADASGGGSGQVASVSVVISPSAGAHTYKLTLQRVSGTGSVQTIAGSTFPNYILVEDISGSSIGAHTHTELDDTGWIPINSFANSWTFFGGSYGANEYAFAAWRKKAGIVYLRGLIASGTVASGTVMFTLPVGFRPAAGTRTIYSIISNDVFGGISINAASDGGVRTHGTVSNVYVSLANVSFPADG